MAANTGPDSNTYIIPEVDLADTFNVWRDTTNTQSFKLNKMKIYDGVSSSTILLTVSEGGTFQSELADTIVKSLTFSNPVVFSSGVTFNGDVTFNAQTFTVNANNVTIDDYAVVLGATQGTSDANINAAGGGGLLLSRGGSTAAWVWRAEKIRGLTGIWNANAHIGLCGASAGLYPDSGTVLPVYGTGIHLAGNTDTSHGLRIDLTNGTGTDSVISLSRQSPAGSTAFVEVLNGTTYGTRPFVNIPNGANKKTVVTPTSHGFGFGTPLTINTDGSYRAARANSTDDAEVVGIVSRVISANEFEMTFIGDIFGDFSGAIEGGIPGSSQLQTGTTYYLSPNQSGKITSIQPRTAGTVHKAVLIATGPRSATVIPFTGGLLSSTISVSTVSSVATRLKQYNRFKVGDVLRFKANPNGITLSYNLSGGVVAEEWYEHGVYYRAQANSAADATVAGMVIRVDEPIKGSNYENDPTDVVWKEFDILMDGWFDGLSGLIPGTEYNLALNAVGSGPAGEGSQLSYSTAPPGGSDTVVKKLFMATSPTSGYLYSYRGDVVAATDTTTVSLTNSLITDLRSDVASDLKIGVYSGGGAGGRPSIFITPEPTAGYGLGSKIGNVGIGLDSWANYKSGSDGNRIVATLDLAGWMRVGETYDGGTIRGQDLIVVRDRPDAKDTPVPPSRIVIGNDHTRGNLVLGYKVRPDRNTANAFVSSISQTHNRSALVMGEDGTNPSISLLTAKASSAAAGSNVGMKNVFGVVNSTTYCKKSTNSDSDFALRLDSDSSNRWIAFNPDTTSGAWGGLAEAGNASIVFSSGSIDTGGLSIMPWNNSSHGLRILANGNVGIGVKTPTVPLDVNGLVRSSATVQQITDPQHLVTKQYVDSISITATQGVTGGGTSTGITINEYSTFSELQKITGSAYAELSSLRVTVTPKSTSSKFYFSWDSSRMTVQTRRPGSGIWTTVTGVFGVTRTIGGITTRVNGQLDSPNTTSQVTYNFRAISSGTSGRQPRVTYVDPTHLTVIEI